MTIETEDKEKEKISNSIIGLRTEITVRTMKMDSFWSGRKNYFVLLLTLKKTQTKDDTNRRVEVLTRRVINDQMFGYRR